MWHWWAWISGHGGVGLIVGLDGFRGLFQLMILWFHNLGFAGGGLESQHSAAGCVIIFCTTGNQQGVEASFTTPVRFSRAYLSVPGSWPQARWALEARKYGQEPSTFVTAISTSLAMICIVEVLCVLPNPRSSVPDHLLAPHTTIQNSNSLSESSVQVLLELWLLV